MDWAFGRDMALSIIVLWCRIEGARYFCLSLKRPNQIIMLIERTKSEVIIRLPSSVDMEGVQRLVDYLSYKEATSKSKAKQADVDKLAKKVKKGWWEKNRSRSIK
jgi:hypothetical protein